MNTDIACGNYGIAHVRAISRTIWVTFQRAGFHHYPDAPPNVNYLASRHRHLFKFKVSISVYHNERDIEYHTFLSMLESLYDSKTLELDNRSCESIAEELMMRLIDLYPDRNVSVEVSEDGECGSVISSTL